MFVVVTVDAAMDDCWGNDAGVACWDAAVGVLCLLFGQPGNCRTLVLLLLCVVNVLLGEASGSARCLLT